jgi:dienelactone hydrolase
MRPVTLPTTRFRWLASAWLATLFALGMLSPATTNCQTQESIAEAPVTERQNYHTAPEWTPSLMKDQHKFPLISPLVREDGRRVSTPQDWYRKRRPQLINQWTRILGKLGPSTADERWFGDVSQVVIRSTRQQEGYTRIDLAIPIEKDFLQDHLLLLPQGQGPGPFPAVIAWTSTTPDYTQPEQWWGSWLARRGYVVLTSWSFIRHYRNGADYRKQANELVYERFGHWLPLAKMVHDVQREVAFLRTRSEVDSRRIGFIGFSLSGKTALYVAAFAPEITATVAVDPHVALHGATNYHDPWYLDWKHTFPTIRTDDYPMRELRNTIWSLLDADPGRPGFERNHHELMALCAPRALLLIGCSMDKPSAVHSDDMQSWSYFNAAREVYELLGVPERFELAATDQGHRATSPRIDAAWQAFFEKWLKTSPIQSSPAEPE